MAKSNIRVHQYCRRRRSCTARREDIAAEIIHVRCATIRVLAAIANAMGRGGQRATLEATYLKTGRLASIRRPVQSIVEYLLVCGSLGDVQSEVVSCLSDLADAHRATDIETFVADHAQALVEFVSQVRVLELISKTYLTPTP